MAPLIKGAEEKYTYDRMSETLLMCGQEAFGQLNTHELKSGGTDIPVTEDNKEEYVEMMLRWRLERGVSQPMEALKKGFMEVLPVHLLINFDAQELEFLMAGTLEIDLDDWKGNTEYRNGVWW